MIFQNQYEKDLYDKPPAAGQAIGPAVPNGIALPGASVLPTYLTNTPRAATPLGLGLGQTTGGTPKSPDFYELVKRAEAAVPTPKPSPQPSPKDTQVGGGHYTKMPIQVFEFTMSNKMDPMQHTIIKYVSRFRDKGGREDLEKAKHTIDLLIENDYGVQK